MSLNQMVLPDLELYVGVKTPQMSRGTREGALAALVAEVVLAGGWGKTVITGSSPSSLRPLVPSSTLKL